LLKGRIQTLDCQRGTHHKIGSNLNPKIFDKDCEQIPIRKGLGEGLVLAGEKDPQIVALCADLTESTQMHLFKNKFK
jgi:transketolase